MMNTYYIWLYTQQIPNQEHLIPEKNDGEGFNNENPLPRVQTMDGNAVPPTHQQSQTMLNSKENTWLREEYDNDTQDREIWFDVSQFSLKCK